MSDIRFKSIGQSEKSMILLHETCGYSALYTEGHLLAYGLGVHYIVDADGRERSYNPHSDIVQHAGRWSRRAIGIEVVTPYYHEHQCEPWDTVLQTSWSGRLDRSGPHDYVPPTRDQLEALTGLVARLGAELVMTRGEGLLWTGLVDRSTGERVMEPHQGMQWIGFDASVSNRYRFDHIKWATPESYTQSRSSITAHAHVSASRADGAFPLLYCWYRIACSQTPDEAWQHACATAQGPRLRGGWYEVM